MSSNSILRAEFESATIAISSTDYERRGEEVRVAVAWREIQLESYRHPQLTLTELSPVKISHVQ